VNDSPEPRSRSRLKQLAALLIVGGVVYFFWKAIRSNWDEIRSHPFQFDYPFIALCFVGILVSSLLATYAWQVTINSLCEDNRMTFSRSVATVNTTSLTKYLPGKFWSYALQMYWLVRHGYSKSLVLYVNLINLLISLLTGVILSLGFLLFTDRFPISITLSALALVLVLDFVCIRFHSASFELASILVKKLFKREIGCFDIRMGTMLRLHGIHLLAQLISAVGAYLLCFGIGYRLGLAEILLVMSALILADVAGFIAFLVPGGLGVREATMYLLLGGAAAGSLALVLPIASRLLYMAGDALLGAIALKLLHGSVESVEVPKPR
jgi:uncharacterized membrane protein YbhN (UPF0104 family)